MLDASLEEESLIYTNIQTPALKSSSKIANYSKVKVFRLSVTDRVHASIFPQTSGLILSHEVPNLNPSLNTVWFEV